jgi:adenylate cyclase
VNRVGLKAQAIHPAWFALASACLSLLLYWYHPPLLDRVDQAARDLVLRLRDTPAPPEPVALVSVDERAVKTHGRWPWPRALQARLIEALKQAGAGVIALDIVYLKSEGPEADQALIQALELPGAPVIGGYFFREQQSLAPGEDALAVLRDSRIRQVLRRPGADASPVEILPYAEVSQASIAGVMGGLGFFNVAHDPDGLVRSAHLVMGHGAELYPSLPLRALAAYGAAPASVALGPEGVSEVRLGGAAIPVDRRGELALNFYSRDRSIRHFSAADVLDGRLGSELSGALVFVGVTELGIADLRPTPVSDSFPGVAVHATVAANVLQGWYLKRDARAVTADVLTMLLLPLVTVWGMARARGPLRMLGVALAVAAAGALALRWLLVREGLLVSLAYPVSAVAIAGLSLQSWYMITVGRRSRFLRRAFAAYVAPALVQRVVDNPDSLSLSGEKRQVTVFFSDIRGFTSITESLPPERMVKLLNRYLSRMSDIVMDHQGTLEKYIGDAIMALYNAPLELPGHPSLAARTALRMLQALEELNDEFERDFGLRIRIGVGINTGDAIIGNLGSERRFHYAAVGDTVNLGARLESRTKAYGVDVIVSGATREQLAQEFLCRHLDRLQVKGKSEPVEIHELMSADTAANRQLAQRFEEALEHYFAGRFGAALEALGELMRDYPGDGPSQVLADRCRGYLQQPPPPDWSGVHVARDK